MLGKSRYYTIRIEKSRYRWLFFLIAADKILFLIHNFSVDFLIIWPYFLKMFFQRKRYYIYGRIKKETKNFFEIKQFVFIYILYIYIYSLKNLQIIIGNHYLVSNSSIMENLRYSNGKTLSKEACNIVCFISV